MAMLVHEIWEDEDGTKGVCLAGPDGDGFRKLLSAGSRCISQFKAESHFEAMTIYYRFNGWGSYTADFAADHEPYPDDWAARQASMSAAEFEIMVARRAILETARDLLAGKLSYIEGARKIRSAHSKAKLNQWDADLVPFTAIDSETDALPVGSERVHWQAAALVALQPEIDRTEAWAREVGEPYCHNLIARFATDDIEN